MYVGAREYRSAIFVVSVPAGVVYGLFVGESYVAVSIALVVHVMFITTVSVYRLRSLGMSPWLAWFPLMWVYLQFARGDDVQEVARGRFDSDPRTIALVERLARQEGDRARVNEVCVDRIRPADEKPYKRRYRRQSSSRGDRGA